MQASAVPVQFVLGIWWLVFDFAVQPAPFSSSCHAGTDAVRGELYQADGKYCADKMDSLLAPLTSDTEVDMSGRSRYQPWRMLCGVR
eukprot:874060-Rhodomonas_salina.2